MLYFSTDGCINKSLTYLLTYLLTMLSLIFITSQIFRFQLLLNQNTVVFLSSCGTW